MLSIRSSPMDGETEIHGQARGTVAFAVQGFLFLERQAGNVPAATGARVGASPARGRA